MKVIVIMPTYRAGKRAVDTFQKIPPEFADNVIISDDASPDNTYELVKGLPATVLRNERNRGYGGNLKILLVKALETDGDIFVELHGDGQYDPKFITAAVQAFKAGDGMVLGSRLMEKGKATSYGMPVVKYWVNILLTWLANAATGRQLTEFQSGFRLYRREFLEKASFQQASDDHLFSLETILLAFYHGFTVSEVPVVCTYEPGVTHMRLGKGIKYVLEMMRALVRYRLAKMGLPDSVFRV